MIAIQKTIMMHVVLFVVLFCINTRILIQVLGFKLFLLLHFVFKIIPSNFVNIE